MKKKNVDSKLWMHREVNELIGFAFEEGGKKGIEYVAKEVKRLSKSILKDNLKVR
jgi:hypothetical protein